ncbi:alpha/beta hydrolase [Paenibacillus darwinianus]|uniref:Alpha/beta hydrolase n=1 Tax=Paenibacillus darwinianus TaxID=1380763 RepID=A0A9W5S367_9BACL|nr:alpha/beta hydrolase [Paenibacillus darwinianus]EXX90717.1 alpha/beta hydrolase [Paenibacillus darwinianus]EXX90923.1 alpha/beta hydrolase [Paenibacillus darwinianus]
MKVSPEITPNAPNRPSGTILWLAGWSMPPSIFDRFHDLLPDFHHGSIDYSAVETPDELFAMIDNAFLKEDLHPPLLIAGWSLGSLLALHLAESRLADGLVLLSGTACFVRPQEARDRGWPEAYVRQMIAAIRKDRSAVEAKFRTTLLTDTEWTTGLGEMLPQAGYWTTSALITGLHILRTEECLSRLNRITCPVFLIHGSEDTVCPHSAAEELLAQLPHAELLTVEGSGHVPFLGREAILADAIRRWWHGVQVRSDSTSI